MNFSAAANFTNSHKQCFTAFIYHFQVTTAVLVPCVLSCLLDVLGILISTPGNLLVILLIILDSSLHHNAHYVLLLLAVSDFLIGALLQLLLFVYKIQHLLSRPSCITATVFQAIIPIVFNASVISEMLVSLERTVAVMAPYWYDNWVTPRRLFALPVCVWFIWTIVELSLFFARLDGETILLLPAAFMVLCLLVTVVCYGLLFKIANRLENQVQAQRQQVQRSEEEKKRQKRERKALWTALYINGAYFVGYLPIISLAIVLAAAKLSETEEFLLHSWCTTIAFLIASANPIILCWRNTSLGSKMRKFIRLQSSASNDEAAQPDTGPVV